MNINTEASVELLIDDNQIATITFNRPKSLNALNREVLSSFKEALLSIRQNSNVLGLIITGTGEKSFIAGADIKEMLEMDISEAKAFSQLGQEVTCLMEDLKYRICLFGGRSRLSTSYRINPRVSPAPRSIYFGKDGCLTPMAATTTAAPTRRQLPQLARPLAHHLHV